MSKAADNSLESLLPKFLFELGLRNYELENLDISDLQERDDYWEISVDYRDGTRRLMLVESVPELEAWLEDHPESEEHSPLLVRNGKRITGQKIRLIVKKLGAKANESDKKLFGDECDPESLTPHDFRFSCALDKCEKQFSNSLLKHWFGWSTSEIPRNYQEEYRRRVENEE